MPKNTFDDSYVADRTITVSETGCMVWMLGTVKGGYGKVSKDGRSKIAHRVIWEARNGPVPEGYVLCHRCDVPSCVNPDHLFVGTHKQNSMDMVKKGRSTKGEKVAISVLTENSVREIRCSDGSYADKARRYNVHPSTIRQIMLRETWRHVE